MIDVIDLQRRVKLDAAEFRKYITLLLSSVEEVRGRTFSVAFVSDRRMRELNKYFRGIDRSTDVLSFPHEPDEFTSPEPTGFLGDIVISAEQAARQARENKLTLEGEVKQLILHGVLHLCGYDHETDNGEMNARELELRSVLHI